MDGYVESPWDLNKRWDEGFSPLIITIYALWTVK